MQTNNHILAALPKRDYQRLRSKLEKVALVYNTDVYAAGALITSVYFPESGIVSLLAVVGKRSTIEVGIVGDEGMIGLPLFLGVKNSLHRAVVQGAGSAMKMTSADFLSECAVDSKLVIALRRYAYWRMVQISQSAACNRFHPIEARLARWLLMTGDRMKSDSFKITQEFLANMIGVRREAVNKAATAVQDRGLISYVRGSISILDRETLLTLACDCYEILHKELPT